MGALGLLLTPSPTTSARRQVFEVEGNRHRVRGRGFRIDGRLGLAIFLGLVAGCTSVSSRGPDSGPLPVVARWRAGRIPLQFVPSQSRLDGPLSRALMSGVNTWNELLAGCGTPTLVIQGTNAAGQVARNARSQVALRTKTWCPDGRTSVDCYDATRPALTQSYVALDGANYLTEADVEINSVDFSWSSSGGSSDVSLERVVLHELGHVLGLGEACVASHEAHASGEHPCSEGEIEDSVMYPGMFAPRTRIPLGPVMPGGAERSALCEAYAR